MAPEIELLPHARVLKDRYRAWLCDVWGVVHNGVRAFPSAVEALVEFRAAGGAVLLLTNAPRPAGPILKQLAQLGVPEEAFDEVVTSGDAARAWLRQLDGRPSFHLGPERDRPLFEDLGLNLVQAAGAEVVVCTGLVDDETETVDDYQAMLAELAGRGVTMMCANPDLVIDRGGRLVPCAGALADAYQRLGGLTVFTGKPHQPIYDLALARLAKLMGGSPKRADILTVGDGLDTDIAGAEQAEIDSLFIIGGIHAADVADGTGEIDRKRLRALFAGRRRVPVAAQRELVW